MFCLSGLNIGEMAEFACAVAVGYGKEFFGEARSEYTFAGARQLAIHYGWFGVASGHEVAAYGVEIIVNYEVDAAGIETAWGVAQQRGPVREVLRQFHAVGECGIYTVAAVVEGHVGLYAAACGHVGIAHGGTAAGVVHYFFKGSYAGFGLDFFEERGSGIEVAAPDENFGVIADNLYAVAAGSCGKVLGIDDRDCFAD